MDANNHSNVHRSVLLDKEVTRLEAVVDDTADTVIEPASLELRVRLGVQKQRVSFTEINVVLSVHVS